MSVQDLLNIPKVLSENLTTIRAELGSSWSSFQDELTLLLKRFNPDLDPEALETTINKAWQLCCRHPFVKGLILGYGLGYEAKPGISRWRKLEAAQFRAEFFEDDKELVREIISRFQSLSDKLKEV